MLCSFCICCFWSWLLKMHVCSFIGSWLDFGSPEQVCRFQCYKASLFLLSLQVQSAMISEFVWLAHNLNCTASVVITLWAWVTKRYSLTIHISNWIPTQFIKMFSGFNTCKITGIMSSYFSSNAYVFSWSVSEIMHKLTFSIWTKLGGQTNGGYVKEISSLWNENGPFPFKL